MNDKNILDQMYLPLSSNNEDLETISRSLLYQVFIPDKFELRSEHERDKGNDFTLEIKNGNSYTGFRAVIQLKATASIKKNKKGSYNLSIDTSNINYLLNNPFPAYYILYVHQENKFFYENISDFVRELNLKNNNWDTKRSHTIRFSKELNGKTDEIYQVILKKGILQRKLNEKLFQQNIGHTNTDKILIDSNLNVLDDTKIRDLIETGGLYLINEGRWKEIIELHHKASNSINSTPLYNLIIGIAHYYSGNPLDSLAFLKKSILDIENLPKDLLNYLFYFEATVRYSLGIIDDSEFKVRINKLELNDDIGLHIKLDRIKGMYFKSNNYHDIINDITMLMKSPAASNNFKLMARCELILFEGYLKNIYFVQNVGHINEIESRFGASQDLRVDSVKDMLDRENSWEEKVKKLEQDCLQDKNYIAFFNTILNKIKIKYELIVYTSIIHVEKELLNTPKPPKPDTEGTILGMLKQVEEALNFYTQIGYTANICFVLFLQYELFHFINKEQESIFVLNKLKNIIETNDIVEYKQKLQFLINGGTTHEAFKKFIQDISEETELNNKINKEEYDSLLKSMKEMDRMDINKTVNHKKSNAIHLFPIGYFRFPSDKVYIVLQILNIQDEGLINHFNDLFSKVIPIANIYYSQITEEGYAEGELANRGLDSFRNIYRIRKAFFDNDFIRFDPFYKSLSNQILSV